MGGIVTPAYNAWADAVLVARLRRIERTPAMEGVLAHLAVAGEVWLARMDGAPPPPELWPALPFEEAVARLAAVDARLGEARDPDGRFRYRNSTGAEFENGVEETIAHVLNHATYHRGEIAGLMLAAGLEPPVMDLVAYGRKN